MEKILEYLSDSIKTENAVIENQKEKIKKLKFDNEKTLEE